MRWTRVRPVSLIAHAMKWFTVGAVLSTLLAWGICGGSDFARARTVRYGRFVLPDGRFVEDVESVIDAEIPGLVRRSWWTRSESPIPFNDGSPRFPSDLEQAGATPSAWIDTAAWSRVASWGHLKILSPKHVALGKGGLEQAAGWPMLAYWGAVPWNETGKAFVYSKGGICLPPAWTPENMASMRALSVWPIWGGLLVDSAFFGAAAWVCVRLATIARRYPRYLRGRCPKCAYDLGFDYRAGCPECGWGRDGVLKGERIS